MSLLHKEGSACCYVIDTHIEALRKEVADLEGRRERFLSSNGGSSHFGDQPLISGLC